MLPSLKSGSGSGSVFFTERQVDHINDSITGSGTGSGTGSDTDSDMEEYNDMRGRMNQLYEESRKDLLQYIDDNNIKQDDDDDEGKSILQFYDYPAVKTRLNKNTEELAQIIKDNGYETGTIHLCAYHVNITGQHPFLQFILQKYNSIHEESPDLVKFPEFDYTKGVDIMALCDCLLNILFTAYSKTKANQSQINSYVCNGFIQNGADFYFFFDCSSYQIESHKLCRNNDMWLTLIDEIVNYKSVCNFKIDKTVTNFFMNNTDFIYLTDINDDNIEIPAVAYTGCHHRMLNFKLIFGQSATNNNDIIDTGAYYYFTDYYEAVKLGSWSLGKKVEIVNDNVQITDEFGRYDKGGIVRFAIFTGHMYNNDNNNNDINATKEWTMNYDYDSMYYQNFWVLKMFEQHTSLSSHNIDNNLETDTYHCMIK